MDTFLRSFVDVAVARTRIQNVWLAAVLTFEQE
jgi:hypothetical protein